MGQNNDYADDVNQEDAFYATEDQEDDDTTAELDPESWQDWNSEHLLNMYMSLVDYCETQGLQFMKSITFNEFCHFIFNRAV